MVFVVSVAAVPLPDDVDAPPVDVESLPVVAVPVVDVALAELVEDDSDAVPVVSAAARP